MRDEVKTIFKLEILVNLLTIQWSDNVQAVIIRIGPKITIFLHWKDRSGRIFTIIGFMRYYQFPESKFQYKIHRKRKWFLRWM